MVVECMALQPSLQSLCELKLIQATHGVITNARADHLDVMGPNGAGRRPSTGGNRTGRYTTVHGRATTSGVFQQAAQDRHCQVIAIDDDDVAEVTWDELERFPYVEHPDNVALALRVCTDLGVDRQTALRGMWQAQPDAGVMTVFHTQGSRAVGRLREWVCRQ